MADLGDHVGEVVDPDVAPELVQELHDLAVSAVVSAVPAVSARFRASDLSIEQKAQPADVVTDADLLCESLVRTEVLAARRDDAFVGEEGGSSVGSSGVEWILDPIDSTANFARGIPTWAVSLAAAVRGRIVAAVVACPPAGEVVSASSLSDVSVNGRPTGLRPAVDLKASMVVVGFASRSDGVRPGAALSRLLPVVGKVRSPGSPALGLAWTATGRFDAAYYDMDFKVWDVAAGRFLCERAGLRTEQLDPCDQFDVPRLLVAHPDVIDSFRSLTLAQEGSFGRDR